MPQCGKMDTRVGLLIIGVGLLGLAAINHSTNEADPFIRQKTAARQQILGLARDPGSVVIHSLSGGGDGGRTISVMAEFSSRNGFGGMNREHWRLDFEKGASAAFCVRDEKTGRVVYDARPPPASPLIPASAGGR